MRINDFPVTTGATILKKLYCLNVTSNSSRVLVVFLILLATVMNLPFVCASGSGLAPNLDGRIVDLVGRNSEYRGDDPSKVRRDLKLYSRCSGQFVQMYSRVINARGKLHSPFVILRVESDSFGSRVRIKSQRYDRYICFNRKRRLTSRFNGRSQRCVFTEVLAENAFTELQSAWNPSLHLGFNYRGKSINPRQYRAQRECFQFVKQDERRLLEFEDRLAPPSIRGLHKAIGNRNATGHLRKRPAGGR